MINKENFKCKRCGDCCKYTVKLTKTDLKKLKTNLTNYEDYINSEENPPTIKLQNNKCIFLKTSKENKSYCEIYNFRPQICRDYPFFKQNTKLTTCNPDQNTFLHRYNSLKLIPKKSTE